MKYAFPRVIKANRGDLASRWALLNALNQIEGNDFFVFAHLREDIPPFINDFIPYGPLRNALLTRKGWRALRKSDVVIWGVGLDLQDDSSLMRLSYLLILYTFYRLFGLEIWSLFQGAGPIETPVGRYLARQVLKRVNTFVARDPQSLALVQKLSTESKTKTYLGHDAIFFSGLEKELDKVGIEERKWIEEITEDAPLVIAFNIRQWFHFSSSFLPYQFSKEKYRARSENKMQELVNAARQAVRFLNIKYHARVLLISAYQPNIEEWEDDLPWLQAVAEGLEPDDDVILIDRKLTLPAYFLLMSRLDLVIGMRLHTALIALRFGVPAINLSYTLKGGSILSHLGLPEYLLEINDFLKSPENLEDKIASILKNLLKEKEKTSAAAKLAIKKNEKMLRQLFLAKDTHPTERI